MSRPPKRKGTQSRGGRGSPRSGGSGGPPDRRTRPRGLGGEQVEGRQAVRELLLAGRRKVQEILVEDGLRDAETLTDIRHLAAEARVPVREVSKARLASQARTDAPQGVLARAARLQEADLDDLASDTRPFLVAFDGVTDPGNLGAALRSAEGAGATGAVLPRHRAVNVTPTVAKAAAGAVEHLPIALVGGLPAALAHLRERGLVVIGLDEVADRPLHALGEIDGGVVLVLGSEGRGLGRLVRSRCDQLLRIPMAGRLASLNVSAAAALACFEVARRRAGA